MVSRLTYTLDCCDPESLVAFWTEALGYSLLGQHGSFWLLIPPEDVHEPWFILQQVNEPKSGKNRMHVDIQTHDLDAESRRLESLGATRVAEPRVIGDFSWIVMEDPEGNEFCLVRPG